MVKTFSLLNYIFGMTIFQLTRVTLRWVLENFNVNIIASIFAIILQTFRL